MGLRLVTPDFTPESALVFNTPPSNTYEYLKKFNDPCDELEGQWYIFLEYMFCSYVDQSTRLMMNSNYQCGLEALGGTSETVIEHDGNIMINEKDKKALKAAEEMLKMIREDYPLIDDMHYYEMKREEDQEALDTDMRYHLKDLCKALGLDSEKLKKRQRWTLEALITESYFYSESYSGKAYFCLKFTKDQFKILELDYLNPKMICNKTMKLITDHFST